MNNDQSIEVMIIYYDWLIEQLKKEEEYVNAERFKIEEINAQQRELELQLSSETDNEQRDNLLNDLRWIGDLMYKEIGNLWALENDYDWQRQTIEEELGRLLEIIDSA
jgi:hypothetical protein